MNPERSNSSESLGSPRGRDHPAEPLTALGRQDLLDIVDHVAVELGSSSCKDVLGKGPGHLTATHHGMV